MPITINTPDGSSYNFPEGMSQVDIQAAMDQHLGQNKPTVAEDLFKAAPGMLGTAADVAVTSPFDMANLAVKGGQWAAKHFDPSAAAQAETIGQTPVPTVDTGLGKAVSGALEPVSNFLSSQGYEALSQKQEDVKKAAAAAKGVPYTPPYEPKTLPVKMGQGALNMGAAALGTGGIGDVPSIIRALAAGATSEAGGELAHKYLPSFETPARLGSAIVGGGLPSAARRVVTPFPIKTPEYMGAQKLLSQEGIPLSPARVTGSPTLTKIESWMGPPAGTTTEAENAAVSKRAMSSMGSPHPTPNTPVSSTGEAVPINQVASGEKNAFAHQVATLKQGYEDFFNNNTVTYNPVALKQNLDNVVHDYEYVAGAQKSDAVRQAADLVTLGKSGKPMANAMVSGIDGNRYQFVKDALDDKINAASGTEKAALIKIKQEMDNTFKSSLPPDKLQQLQTLNDQYANSRIVAKSIKNGEITPKSLAQAAKSHVGNETYAAGNGPSLVPLARAGETVLRRRPAGGGSDWLSQALGGVAGAAGGGLLPYMLGHGQEAFTSGILGAMVGPQIARLTATPAARAAYNLPGVKPWLSNQAINIPSVNRALAPPDKEALIKLLGQTGVTLPASQQPSAASK
jgi:hypothetical protein